MQPPKSFKEIDELIKQNWQHLGLTKGEKKNILEVLLRYIKARKKMCIALTIVYRRSQKFGVYNTMTYLLDLTIPVVAKLAI